MNFRARSLALLVILSVTLPGQTASADAVAKVLRAEERAQKRAERKAAKGDEVTTTAFAAPTGSGQVTVDFTAVEYFPNLKSKIGFASNYGNEGLELTLPFLQEIGPGLVCHNLEFDHWFKFGTEPVPALLERYQTEGDATTRPVETLDRPAPWLWDYSTAVGDSDMAQLIQLTGAPAQYQVAAAVKPAIHPGPTDPEAAAELVGRWTAAANHPFPVLWSVWNEPGHTLAGVDRGKDVAGNLAFPDESAAQFDSRAADQRAAAAEEITRIFGLYSQAMRPTIGPHARMGLASMLTADFNPQKLTPAGRVFFDQVMEDLATSHPDAGVDFLTFNSFNGIYSIPLNGSRAVLAGQPAGPVILTQYAPRILKMNPDGEATKKAGATEATPLQAAAAMLTDLAGMQRATDLQHACMAYWLGGKFGLLSDRNGTIRTNVRYHALKMFTDLPILRTSLDFGETGLAEAGLQGLAGVNSARAAVLFWNEGDQDLTVPMEVANLPAALSGATARVSTLAEGDDEPQNAAFDDTSLTVPANGVAMLTYAASAPDPLARRKSLAPARFLATASFPDRVTVPCTDAIRVQGVETCGATSGTFGFYDSVRAVGYLGKGTGDAEPRLTASYENLPAQIALASTVIGTGTIALTADYAVCDQSVTATEGLLDASALPADCAAGPVTLTMALKDASTGAQAEVYLDPAAQAAAPVPYTPALQPAASLSIVEALEVLAFDD